MADIMKIIKKYKITYKYDTKLKYTVSQYKYLISYSDYINDIKPKLEEIYNLECLMNSVSKNNNKYKEAKQRISEIKKHIHDTYGDYYFTDNSPLYKSIFTGVLIIDNKVLCQIEFKEV